METSLTPAQYKAYLAHVGLDRPETADVEALTAIQRAHAYAFTWECLDCFMGWPTSLAPQEAFAKMVGGGRGGWCYEMNGLLGAALSAAGFQVTRLAGGVRRDEMGDLAVGNHLTLRIDLDGEAWLADVGLGDALIEPVRFQPADFSQRGYRFAITPADGEWLRLRSHPWSTATTVDFRPNGADEAALAGAQGFLLRDDRSPFRNNLVMLRHYPDRVEGLVNLTRRTVTPGGVVEQPVEGRAEFDDLLGDVFKLALPDPSPVWDKVSAIGAATFA